MYGETTLIDEQVARLHAHRNNIARYRSLLKTPLTDVERHFIEDRLTEELKDTRIAEATRAGQESRTSPKIPAGTPQKKDARSAA